MAREIIQRNALLPMTSGVTMQKPDRLEYLGALLDDSRRLVLVTVDPKEPWEAFRRMRRTLRKEKASSATAIVDIFESNVPVEREAARVIPIQTRRRAG